MRKVILTIIGVLALVVGLMAQETRLAQQYFQDGEYEKAAQIYEKLYKQNNRNDYFFDRFVDCLIALEDYDKAEDLLRKQLKKSPENSKLYVNFGKLLERQFKDAEAQQQFAKAVEVLPNDQYSITRLANAFIGLTKYDLAIATYEKGAKLLRNERIFAYNLGDLYRRMGDIPAMITQYLNALEDNPNRSKQLKTLFQRYLSDDDLAELQEQLYTRIQDKSDVIEYPELLSWVFIQRKDYKNAFRQVRALDRRLDENGGRIYQLGSIAMNDKDYDSAIMAFDYIVESKGMASSFYLDAKQEALRARRSKLTDGYSYTEEDLRTLETQYESFLDEFGRSRNTAGIILELAELEALYLNDRSKSISLLEEMINYPNVDPRVQALGKLKLGDYYLMDGDIWESTLLYSQVDKAFKEDILGHEARYRNARLSYFASDFQWAQAQFDVLKASTSKLISNDAIDMSVFIMDNMGLDTTAEALSYYADADLLVFQNRFTEAFEKMDTLMAAFPKHDLQDDVLYLRAKIHEKRREYERAAAIYQTIYTTYPEGIRADNSIFNLAGLYENQLNQPEKAMELYEMLFIDFSGSTLAVEGRKAFRRLRGDGDSPQEKFLRGESIN